MSRVSTERDSCGDGLNLARQPFRNLRPIVRLVVLLWLLGTILLVVNAMQYWRYFTGSEDRRAELEQLQEQIELHREDIGNLEARFRSLDLRRQNAEVRFLNHKISERTFSWSGLFDRLADVLPNDVRLVSLSPETERGASGRSRRASSDDDLADGEIRLGIVGVARTPEAQLEFIEALFAHPAFRDPDLSRDSISDGQIRFDMTTIYLPDDPAPVEEPVQEAEAESVDVADSTPSTEPASAGVPGTGSPTSGTPGASSSATGSPSAGTPAGSRAATVTPPATATQNRTAPAAAATLTSTSVTGAATPSTGTPTAPRRPAGPVLQQRAPSPGTSGASAPEPSVNPATGNPTNRPLPRQPNASSSPGIR